MRGRTAVRPLNFPIDAMRRQGGEWHHRSPTPSGRPTGRPEFTPRHCIPATSMRFTDGLIPACSLREVLTDDGGRCAGSDCKPSADVILWQERALLLRAGADARAMTVLE